MIKGTEGLSGADIQEEIRKGGRFVRYSFCVSVIVMTFRRSSETYFVRVGQSRLRHAWPYILLTLAVGWWGVPWGPIFSIKSLYDNLKGGIDMTAYYVKPPAI